MACKPFCQAPETSHLARARVTFAHQSEQCKGNGRLYSSHLIASCSATCWGWFLGGISAPRPCSHCLHTLPPPPKYPRLAAFTTWNVWHRTTTPTWPMALLIPLIVSWATVYIKPFFIQTFCFIDCEDMCDSVARCVFINSELNYHIHKWLPAPTCCM
jgi:hypothetical protein